MYFDGINLKNYFKILDIRRNILPPHTILKHSIPGRAGSIVSGSKLEEGSIEVDIELKGKSKPHLRTIINELAPILSSGKPKKLIFTDEPDKYYLAVLEGGTPLREFYTYGLATLIFLVPDPVRYGKKVTIPIEEGDLTFYNLGTYKTKGLLTMKLINNKVRVSNKNTGEFIELSSYYNKGNVVTIDFKNEYIMMNGYSVMDDLILESDFFHFSVGPNTISVVGGPGEIAFRERWL